MDVIIRTLAGDATGSGDVTLSDALLIAVQAVAGTSVGSAPQFDVNADGAIDGQDALAAKARVTSPAAGALCP